MFLLRLLSLFVFLPFLTSTVTLAQSTTSTGLTISSSALADIENLISGAKTLLSTDSIDNIETTLTGAATLLSGTTANDTKTLLTEVSALLSPELISAVAQLVTADTVNKLGDIVNNAHTLLSAEFVNQTTTLINDVTPVSLIFFEVEFKTGGSTDNFFLPACGRFIKGPRRSALSTFGLMRANNEKTDEFLLI